MRHLILSIFFGLMAGALVLAQQPAGPTPTPLQRIETARAALAQIDQTLARPDVSDQTLQGLRADLDPISKGAQIVIDEVSPRLAAVKARIDQLGPRPDAKSPPEDPAVANERDQQQKLLDAADAVIKQARIVLVDSDEIADRIAARRRDIFNRAVFARTSSLLDPRLWSAAIRELPRDIQAAATISGDWVSGMASRLEGWSRALFVSLLAAVGICTIFATGFVRSLLRRPPSQAESTPLARILRAIWVAVLTAIVPVLAINAVALTLHGFDLVSERMTPFVQSFVDAVTRISVSLGMARGVLAPGRPDWRMVDLPTHVSQRLTRLAVIVALVVAASKIVDAIIDLIAASLPVSVLMHGVAALVIALTMAATLRTITADAEDTEQVPARKEPLADWYRPARIVLWLAAAAILASVLVGYIAFATFLVDQTVWVCFVAVLLLVLLTLTDEGLETALKPQTRIGHGLMTSVGFRREELEQIATLLSGAITVALLGIAALLVLAPWGIESSDMIGSLKAAFFGFQVGDFTISLSSVIVAGAIFVAALLVTRAVQRWLDGRFLPLTQLDTGLRNSIRTSMGYLGFVIAASLALARLGLDFQKLAIVAGALSVGIGFGLQSIVNNFVSGLILLWERAIRVGDWVVVGDDQGHVKRINVRSTEIVTFDRVTMIVPNSNLVTGVVKNWVRGDRIGRVKIPWQVALASDPEAVREELLGAARGNPDILKIPTPQVFFIAIADNGLRFELICFVPDVETSARIKSDLHFDVLRRMRSRGIELSSTSTVFLQSAPGMAALPAPAPQVQAPSW